MSVMSGAWMKRARFAAAEGRPIPTKQTSSLRSARAAAIVIISLDCQFSVINLFLCGLPVRRADALCKHFRPLFQDVRPHPGKKRLALTRNGIPGDVEGVVALVIALRIGRIGSA